MRQRIFQFDIKKIIDKRKDQYIVPLQNCLLPKDPTKRMKTQVKQTHTADKKWIKKNIRSFI